MIKLSSVIVSAMENHVANSLVVIRRLDTATVVSCSLIIVSMFVWTCALWPGSVVHDALFLLNQIETHVYTDYFPLLNGILTRILVVPFESIVLYIIAQIAFCIFATIYAIATLRNIGSPAAIIVLVGIFIAASIPIGSYWSVMFKDVPCSFGIVASSILVFSVFIKGSLDLKSVRSILFYGILLVVTGFLRHGWQAVLLVVPGLLTIAAWKTLNRRTISVLWGLPLVLLLIFEVVLPRAIKVADDPHHLALIEAGILIQPFVAVVRAREGYSALYKETDEALLSAIFTDPSKVGDAYNSVNYYPLSVLMRRDIEPNIPRRLAGRLLVLCTLNTGLCLRDRVSMMFGALQASATSYAAVYYNLANPRHAAALVGPIGYMAPLIKRYSMEAPESRSRAYARKILDWSEKTPIKALVWNAVPQFFLLIVGLLCAGVFPATAAACLVMVSMAALQFSVINANDFRYVFFIYLGGIFVIPMMTAEYRAKFKRSLNS